MHTPHTPSQVYLSRHKETGALNAIKVLQKEKIVKCSKVKHIMAKRNDTAHPFIVGLHYSFQTSTNLYFVLDYVNGGTLFFHLQREKVFNESRARWVTSCYIKPYDANCRTQTKYKAHVRALYKLLSLANCTVNLCSCAINWRTVPMRNPEWFYSVCWVIMWNSFQIVVRLWTIVNQ